MKRFGVPILSLLLLMGCAARRSEAQFIGYVSPQTVQTTLASSVACNGGTQLYTTGITANFQNLGQTYHVAVVSLGANITSLQVAIFGLDNTGIATQISDTGYFQTNVPIVVIGYGYYPQVQIQVTCNSGGAYSLSYSGSSSAPSSSLGAQLQAQLIKSLAIGRAANANFSTTLITPFGNASGLLTFTSGGGAPSGSTLSVSCNLPSGAVPITGSPFPLNTGTNSQFFAIPQNPCPVTVVTFTSGGASASTYNLTYSFNSPGLNSYNADPCASSGIPKQSAFANITTATTTALVPVSNSASVFVCKIIFQLNSSTASTILFEQGTGVACAGTPAAKTATYTNGTVVSEAIDIGGGSATAFTAGPGNGVCAVTTVGTGPTIPVTITFVQQ